MRRHHWILVLLLTIALPPSASAIGPDAAFNDYIQAIIAEDWPTAESLWLPDEVALSKRLGVEFTGVPLKVDCSSPLLEHRLALRNQAVQLTIADSAIADTLIAKTITMRSGSQTATLSHRYLLVYTGDGWRITSPIYHTTRAWREINTMHVRVRCPADSLINQHALDALDHFIDSLGTIFLFRPEHWQKLNQNKLDYYLADREMIRWLTGYDAHGLTYLPLDAVVTSHLPHDHELVHAVLNYRLAPLPMYTLPAIQEGVAVSYGGRWGKSPLVSMQLGAFVLRSQIMTVDDILTYDGFHSDAADLSYALGGLLTRCLIEGIGFPKFSVLYRRLSGPQQYIRSLSAREVRNAIEESTQQTWEAFVPGCVGREVETISHRGIDPIANSPLNEKLWSQSSGSAEYLVTEDADNYYVEVRGERAGEMAGICMTDSTVFDEPGYRSRLFTDQFPGQKYEGAILGIVFDSLEAGVYDYRTDLLLAKFASGFSDGGSIWDPKARVLRFRVEKRILPIVLYPNTLKLIH